MIKLDAVLVMFAMSGTLLTGCSSTDAPSCSSDDAKKTVLQISEEELRNQLVPKAFGPTQPSYEQLVAIAKDEKSLQRYVDSVDDQMKKITLSLANIRTNGVEKEIKKTSCGADLGFGNGAKPLSITYTVQPTDKGELYVTVFGL